VSRGGECSKWAGLAGVRVGYAVSTSAKLVEGMMALKQPYNISIPADAGTHTQHTQHTTHTHKHTHTRTFVFVHFS
jgi:histidinol-phosphate/aromatic aminotransferase/cobyric acid decarboxylase-like protein